MDPVDELEPAEVLAELWLRDPPRPEWVEPLGVDFPGLAEPTLPKDGVAFDPFGLIHRDRLAFDDLMMGPLDPRLLLVSCNRPADAIADTGYVPGEVDAARVSAVLRSWEERFGAVTTSFWGRVVLAVAAPPPTLEYALRVAAEHYALAPYSEAGKPGASREFAQRLVGEAASRRDRRSLASVSPQVWQLGWD